MGIIVWLIIGGIVGWLASLILRTGTQQEIVLDILVGSVGAIIAGLLGKVNTNQGFSIEGFLYSVLGAIVLLAVYNLVRRVAVR